MREIKLISGALAIVDDCDYEELAQYTWYELKKKHTSYAVRRALINGKWKSIYMHAQIMGTPKGRETHHINTKGLDNQRENLVILTRAQHRKFLQTPGNQTRYPITLENTQSSYVAPCFYTYPYFFRDRPLKYRLSCYWRGKLKHVGYFDTFLAAENAHKAHAARLNALCQLPSGAGAGAGP